MIYTSCNRWFDYDNPVFDLREIAHALSRLCRYTGHTIGHYSVAQHCLTVATMVPARYKREALLHDATEAYMGDVNGILKRRLPDFKAIETMLEEKLAKQFGLVYPWPDCVRAADAAVIKMEMEYYWQYPGCDVEEEYYAAIL